MIETLSRADQFLAIVKALMVDHALVAGVRSHARAGARRHRIR